MKQKKRFFAIIIVCLAAAAVVVMCQRNFYPSPEKVTQRKLDEILKGDEGRSENDKTDLAALFMAKIQETQLACALEKPEDHQKKFFENISIGLQKIDYEVSEITRSDDEAEVSVSINYFRLQEIAQNAQKELQDDLKKNGSLSTGDMIAKLYEIIANEFQKGPSDNSKTEVTVFLHKKNHRWEMDDSFEDEILSAILQQ